MTYSLAELQEKEEIISELLDAYGAGLEPEKAVLERAAFFHLNLAQIKRKASE